MKAPMSESFLSPRFSKTVWLTNHAIEAMAKRGITLHQVKQVIEEGEFLRKDDTHGWLYCHFPNRNDNLVCAAVIDGEALIVKTIMVHWQLRT